MDPEYQEQHLQFVATQNNGSSIADIILAGSLSVLRKKEPHYFYCWSRSILKNFASFALRAWNPIIIPSWSRSRIALHVFFSVFLSGH
jgi:hypothetical protein